MAFKFIVYCALLVVSSAGVFGAVSHGAPPLTKATSHAEEHASASTHQNVVHSFGGPVSEYAKFSETPYASAHKEDTRITNTVYTPTVTKTVAYAAPTHHADLYTHATPVAGKAVYSSHQPAALEHHDAVPVAVYAQYHHHHQPVPSAYAQHQQYQHEPAAPLHTHAAPAAAPKTVSYATPAAPAAPIVYHHQNEAPATGAAYNHGAPASSYSHNEPGVAAYEGSQKLHYSPAEMVSHMSFEGFGTHWSF